MPIKKTFALFKFFLEGTLAVIIQFHSPVTLISTWLSHPNDSGKRDALLIVNTTWKRWNKYMLFRLLFTYIDSH